MELHWSLGSKLGYDAPNLRLHSVRFLERQIAIAADGSWFRTSDGNFADLSRRGSLRRILKALATRSVARQSTTLQDVVEAGWPDERMVADSARTRAHTAIYQLRSLGLRSWLVRRRDGYVLRPTPLICNDDTAGDSPDPSQ